jgi:hypothetical protein
MTEPGNAERAGRAALAADALRTADGHQRASARDVVTELLTCLRHYADRHGIDFGDALTASSRAYTAQRRDEEHAYRVGQEVRLRDGVVLSPSLASLPARGVVAALYPAGLSLPTYAVRFPGEVNTMPFTGPEIEPAPPFPPVRTRQGTVASLAEAEEALISTAARIQISHLNETRPARADRKDRQLLASVLGQACSLTSEEMLRQAENKITAAVQQELAMQAAEDLRRGHARTLNQVHGRQHR